MNTFSVIENKWHSVWYATENDWLHINYDDTVHASGLQLDEAVVLTKNIRKEIRDMKK